MGTSTTTSQALSGWDDTLVELYVDSYDSLVRSARRYLHDIQAAEEAVQDAFVRYHTTGADQIAERPIAYLRTMVINNARTAIRRRACREHHRPTVLPTPPSVEDVCLAGEQARALRAACLNLPAQQRSVLTLRYWHGLSEGEIATELGISAGSVKTQDRKSVV